MDQLLEISDQKKQRSYIPEEYSITDWAGLEPFYQYLMEQEPTSLAELETFLLQRDELEAMVYEDYAWRYIKMTCDTQDEERSTSYQYFLKEIMPHLSVYDDKLNRKLVEHAFFDQLDPIRYQTYTRSLKKEIELFREANIPLSTESKTLFQEFESLVGAMTLDHEGKTLTFQQAAKFMEDYDRDLRKQVWEQISLRREQDRDKIDDVFDKLISVRNQMAQNAGFETYTQYRFTSLGRFDYTQAECRDFHDSVEKVVKPVFATLQEEAKTRLGITDFRPWDQQVDIFGDTPLKPFEGADELVGKSIEILSQLRPELGEMISIMNRKGYLDLESRVGKAPGGYNYPLMESGIPFIFMNAAGTQNDVITMLHESGHAVHAFLTRDLSMGAFKNTPSEVAELASMTMELLALDYYKAFYPEEKALVRAQKGQLLRCITILPWVATVDAFQEWIYDHPDHSRTDRLETWTALYERFHGKIINWEGYETQLSYLWQKQSHIFGMPFYYIEYAIAQLGALAIWKNYKENPEKGLNGYLEALKMGYTRPIPEIYEAAGIRFDFSEGYIREIVEFCLEEYQALEL